MSARWWRKSAALASCVSSRVTRCARSSPGCDAARGPMRISPAGRTCTSTAGGGDDRHRLGAAAGRGDGQHRGLAPEKPHKQVFRVDGYASTGKTTLARHAVAGSKRPVFTAFTGKAATVMRRKGCGGAINIHQLLYRSKNPRPFDDTEEIRITGEKIVEPARPGVRRRAGVRVRAERLDRRGERRRHRRGVDD